MTAHRVDPRSAAPSWRRIFVEELGALAPDFGAPRSIARVLGWMVVCELPEQSAKDIQTGLALSAGSVSAATRLLVGRGMMERVAHPGDRHIYYKLPVAGWERAIEMRLRTLMRLRNVADRALLAAGGEADHRLRDMSDVYSSLEEHIEAVLAKRRAER